MQLPQRAPKRNLIDGLVLPIVCVLCAAPLLAYAYIGTFMRYSGDDYCYGGTLRQLGFWDTQWRSFVNPSPYHGNRYTLTFLSSLSGIFGPIANAILPGLMIFLWVLVLVGLIQSGGRLFSFRFRPLEALLLAEGITFLTLHQTPNLAQSLYWRSGMLPYLAPLVANTFLIIITFNQGRSRASERIFLALTAGLAFFAGGFSETAAVLQFGILLLLLIGSLSSKQIGASDDQPITRATLFALLGTMIAIALLIFSPSNATRLATLPTPPDPLTFLQKTLHDAQLFLRISIRTHFWLNVFATISFSIFSFYIHHKQELRNPRKKSPHFAHLATIPIVGFLLIACCIAPSIYAQSSYPEGRVLITAQFILVFSMAAFGWIIGRWTSQTRILPHRTLQTLLIGSALLLGLSSLYPVAITQSILTDVPRYRKWAQFWDARDQAIRSARGQGIQEIEVVLMDKIIPDVAELQPDPDYWYNNCAEQHYDMRSIRANQPGWDE